MQTLRGALLLLLVAVVPATAQLQLPLVEAQTQAVAGNQMLEVARQGVAQARAMQVQALAGRLPSVSITEQAVRTNNALSAFGFRLRQERVTQQDFAPALLNDPEALNDFQTLIEVRQPIFNGGMAIHGRRAARAGVDAAQAQLLRAEQEVRLNTARAYWGVVLSEEGLTAVRQALATVRSHESIARAHYEEDTAPLSDLLAAQVRVAELRGQELDALNNVASAADNLSLIMGLELSARITPADKLQPLTVDRGLDELIAMARTRRADLRAASHQKEAARHGVGVARAEFLPHLNAFAQADLDADGLLERQGESWTVGAMVTWNLFDGMKSVGSYRQARAQLGQAEAQTRFLEEQVVRDVAAAWRRVNAAQAQVQIAADAVVQAEERLRMTDLQYRETLVTATDLLDAETGLTQARIRRLQALHALNVGVAELEFAVGSEL